MKHFSDRIQPQKLIYRISCEEDIVNRFSTEDCELLSESFLAFIDLMRPDIPEQAPILLEITGMELDEDRKKAIDNSIWLHYRLQMTQIARKLRACRIRIFWFFICTVLSSVLLYMTTKNTTEVAVQFYYLPIWFFGYRLLTYPLQDYLPLRRELIWCRRLAAMKLLFTQTPVQNISEAERDSIAAETAESYDEAMDGIRSDALAKKLSKKDGTIVLRCRAAAANAMLDPCTMPGPGLISGEFASFLEQMEPFADPGRPVELEIAGAEFSQDEKDSIGSAVKNYFRLQFKKAAAELRANRIRILSYALGLLLSSMILYLFGSSFGLGMHEFVLIALWFFGDYLVEYILLGHSEAWYTLKLRRRMAEMKIRFIKS